MKIVIREIHAAENKAALNQEWFVVENTGEGMFNTNGCSVAVGRGKARLRQIGTLDPGFAIAPKEKVRVITGNPGKKAHGQAPTEEGVKNYHLFLAAPLLEGAGSIVAVSLKQLEVTRATFDPKAKDGVSHTTNGAS
jgi:hypothetical protein